MEKGGGSDSDRDPVTGLTAKDRDAIRSSWAMVSKDMQANGTTLMIRSVNVMGRSGNKVRSVGHKSVLWNDQANGTTLMIRSVRVNGHSG